VKLGLDGKVALVTGAGRGIGAATALALSNEGCRVAVVDLPERREAKDVVREMTARGASAALFEADVSSYSGAEQVVSNVVRDLGGLDILVCNAGITRDALVWKMPEESWDEVLTVNLKGYFCYARAAAGAMRERGWGRIVIISSINGIRGKRGQANYAAAKAGGIALMKTLARELGKYQVTVNAVAPGMVETDMVQELPAEIRQRARDETVLGRLGSPEDVASVVLFLCSEPARHVTGTLVKVDGGQYI
jgi:3-oxoacyl-[acyl-carrier protein] reductase